MVLPAVVKQQQEEISRNHVPSLFAVSVFLGRAFPDLIPPLLDPPHSRVCEAISARRIFGLAAT